MKKKLITLVISAALGLFAGLSAKAAAGDIYDICPCDEFGTDLPGAYTDYAHPVDAGSELYFKVRLIARQANGNRWYIKYLGLGDDITMNALYPMQIGIYVSGKREYATLVEQRERGNFTTELIFKYVTKPGDFAMPIRLATETGPAGDDGSSGAYAFNPNRDFWDFRFDETTDNGDGTVTTNTVACSWLIASTPSLVEVGVTRKNDYSLEKCGFYVKTVDFSPDPESNEYWRSIHENSTITGGGTVPKLVASAAPEAEVTLYVWSENEDVFYVNTDNVVNMRVNAQGDIEPRHVGSVTFQGGQITKDFSIVGATDGEGMTANIVLSAYPQYNFSAKTEKLLQDFLTAKVRCIEALPPSVIVECDRNTAYANGDYTTYAAVLNVYLSQAYEESAIDVSITPMFTDGSTADWKQYLRFSTTSDTIDEPMVDGSDAVIPTVRIPAGTTDKQTIYVFALRSDTHTIGSAKVKFQSAIVDNPTADAAIQEKGAKSINISAETTAIIAPSEGSKAVSTTCNDDYPFTIAVSDTFADTHDTTTGYRIFVKYRSSDMFVPLPDSYYVGDGGALYKLDLTDPDHPVKTTDQPILKYTSSGTDIESQVYVVAPVNPNTGSAKKSEVRTFLADVREARSATLSYWDESFTEEKRSFQEGESAAIRISLSEPYEDESHPIYAFLKPSSGATPDMFSAAPNNFILGAANPEGIPVTSVGDTVEGIITFLDGYRTPGLTIAFEVVFSDDQNWDGVDESKRVKGYASTKPTIKIYNVEPTINRMEMNGIKATGDGYHFNNKLPQGQQQKFTLYVADPGTYDLVNDVKPFQVRWTAMMTDGTVYDDPIVIEGNPRENPFEYSFPAAGEWEITAEVMDKDMLDWSEVTYTVYVTVLDQPAVEQPGEDVFLAEKLTANELEKRKFNVGVGYWDPKYNGDLTVVVKVSEAVPGKVNPGTLKLDPAYALTPEAAQTLLNTLADPAHPYDANSDYYVITLNKNQQQLGIGYAELDGTDNASISGFRITSFVINDDVLPTSGKAANAYYLESTPTMVYINNLVPELGNCTLENTNAWKVAGGSATQYPIRWQVRYDVDRDWDTPWTDGSGTGIKITFSGCQNAAEESKMITEASSGTFIPNFGNAQGDQIVTMTIEDKDGGVITFTYMYFVEPSKFLRTIASGPSGGVGTTLSRKYSQAKGRGEGHIWVNGGTLDPGESNYFNFMWNCGSRMSVEVYGWGYKVGDIDDGTLKQWDFKVSPTGKPTEGEPYYAYPNDQYDSYLYTWLSHVLGDNGGLTSSSLSDSAIPEIAGQLTMPTPLGLPGEASESGGYVDTYVEAVFAREWRAADNCGDINQDGIPDRTLIDYDFGIVFDGVGDLVDQSGFNNDNDFLPGTTTGGNTIIPNVVGGWETQGGPFNAFLEIRGFGPGLNAGYPNADGSNPEPDYADNEKRAWLEWKGLSTQEELADMSNEDVDTMFQANIADATTDLANGAWSPERPTNPTEEDTDKDGLADGYEYWFWYGGKVGYYKDGKWAGRMIGRRLNLDHIDIFDDIAADDICAAFDPLVSAVSGDNDATRGSIADRDFDNDGLYDIEEYLIGTNPVDCDTDGDGVPDGYEVMWGLNPLANPPEEVNPDGDFMAYANLAVEGYTIVEFDADLGDGAEHYVYIAREFDGETLVGSLLGTGAYEDLIWTIGGETVPKATYIGASEEINLADIGADGVTETPIENLTLLHNQVYQFFGFDPRTGWSGGCIHGYVRPRWCPVCNDEDGDVVKVGDAGLVVHTRAYTTRDEYYYGKWKGLNVQETTIETLRASCTNPNVPVDGKTYGDFQTAYASTQHGADTDGNGVPDGWEAYVGYDPISYNVPDDASAPEDFDGDGMPCVAEYASTDGAAVYPEECESVRKNSHVESGWFNKFFPTDPHNADTDGDGITDGGEGKGWKGTFWAGRQSWDADFTFIYGTPEDNGLSICIRGGGMNPCSTDTDVDALPDLWEYQYAGIVVTPEGAVVNVNDDEAYTPSLKIADGFGTEDFAPKGNFITGGMDATDRADPGTSPITKDNHVGTIRDRDFDHDGLENFQEYLIQSVRAWRYDDTETPLMGRALVWTDGSAMPEFVEAEDSYIPFDVYSGEAMLANVQATPLWDALGAAGTYTASIDEFDYAALGYFADTEHEWDPGFQYGKKYMRPPQSMVGFTEEFGAERTPAIEFVSTDPRRWDTDTDGMDDFYEVFHGINPLLGNNDVIGAAYGFGVSAALNAWTMASGAAEFDPVVSPWTTGLPNADPDGDGIRNLDEAVNGNLTSPTTYHTDPSPLWMTEPSTKASYVAQYYPMSINLLVHPWIWGISVNGAGEASSVDYMFPFDITEGYDTDGDWIGDGHEVVRNATAITDPLNACDPDRRAALYLPGQDACAYSATEGSVPVYDGFDLFRQFTVEAWIKPDTVDRQQTIVERGFSYPGANLVNDEPVWRANFRLEIDEHGILRGVFDNDNAVQSGMAPLSSQVVSGGEIEPGVWTHVAMTFDGTNVNMFVNGRFAATALSHLIPANGIIAIMQEPGATNSFPMASYATVPGANTVGARRQAVVFDWSAGFEQFTDFFQGYIAEVRFWDGARTPAEVAETYKVRMTPERAAAQREEIYAKWLGSEEEDGATRNDQDGNPALPAQLISVYNFQQLPAALDEGDASQFPSGFELGVQNNTTLTEDEIKIGWWEETPLKSTVYNDTRVLPYAQNVVSHLTRLDGGCDDTMFWTDTWAGYVPASDNRVKSYAFPNGGNPYKGRSFMMETSLRIWRWLHLSEGRADSAEEAEDLERRATFQTRSEFTGLDDLVPLGGAFAKLDADYWDGQGADTAWSDTKEDSDGDGMPDWWETKYGLDPNDPSDMAKIIAYPDESTGALIPAWEAYLRDVAQGMQPDGSVNEDYQSVADADGNGLLDWWQNLYALTTGAADDDDGDGLSNYVEYLLSEVFGLKDTEGKWLRFAPDNSFSVNMNVSDYFYRMNELYVGEIFTDHDRIRDLWESDYLVGSDMISPYLYDADVDADADGWSNYDEFQAGTVPTRLGSLSIDGVQMDEYPIPTIEFTVAYHGNQNIADQPVVVKAWSDQTLTTIPDAVWTLGGEGDVSVTQNGGSNVVTGVKYFGMNPQREMLLHLSPGSVVPGSIAFEFKDLAWILVNTLTGQAYVSDPATAIWEGSIIDQPRVDDLSMGDIVDQRDPTKSLGTINYETGELFIDFTKVRDYFAIVGDISGGGQGDGNWLSIYDLQKSYVRVNWASKLITGGKVHTYYLGKADPSAASNNSLGHVKQGLNSFIAFYDFDKNGMYTPGEPYGFIRNVDIGWNYAKASIELTDTNVVSMRYNIVGDGEGGEGGNGGEGAASNTDRESMWETTSTGVYTMSDESYGTMNAFLNSVEGKDHVRVRIARLAVDGATNFLFSSYFAVVYDRVLDLTADGHPTITEADILSYATNQYDLDWNAAAIDPAQPTLQALITRAGAQLAFTNVYYGVFIGNGDISQGTLTNGTMLAKLMRRKFDVSRLAPTPINDNGLVNVPSPKLSWTFLGDDGEILKNPTYSAFRVRVTGGGLTWTSGYQLMPPRASDGSYTWELPLRVGAIVPGGTAEFRNGETYTWSISVYNAKFQEDSWVTGGTFIPNVLTDSQDYGTAHVAVRYYGPSSVVAAGRPIRVQAFKTPDFSGAPVGEGYVSDLTTVASTEAIREGNAEILGLKAGTYYIRAFVDTDRNGALSYTTDVVKHTATWESWGCYCTRDSRTGTIFTPKSITVGPGSNANDVIPVFIEDCDTDRDSLPDAWEWTQNGNLTSYGPAQINQNVGGFAMRKELADAITAKGSFSTGLAVLTSTNLKSPRVAALLLGTNATGSDAQVSSGLSSAGSDVTVEPFSVAITAIELDREAGTVKITADTEGKQSGSAAITSEIYTIPSGADSLTLTCTVLHCDEIGGAWTAIKTSEVAIKRTTNEYTFDLGGDVDLSSGFFKVKLEK